MPARRKPLGPTAAQSPQGDSHPTPCPGPPSAARAHDPQSTQALPPHTPGRAEGALGGDLTGGGRGRWGGAEAQRSVSEAVGRCVGCTPLLLPSALTARGQNGPGWHTPCFCWVTWDCDSLLCGLGEDHSPRGRESASRGGSPPSVGGWLAQGIHFLRSCPTPLTHPSSPTQAGSQQASEEHQAGTPGGYTRRGHPQAGRPYCCRQLRVQSRPG